MVTLFILLCIYFLPSIIAKSKPQMSGVIILNLFLGWTFVFWVISLAWAVLPSREEV